VGLAVRRGKWAPVAGVGASTLEHQVIGDR